MGRSFVRYVDLTFNRTDTGASTPLGDLITGGRVRLVRHGLDGTGSQSVPLAGVLRAIDHAIEFDFGVNGVGGASGGNGNSTIGDGYYEIGLDLDGNGTFETAEYFYRLLGDVNGDRTVNDTDLNLIVAAYGQTGAGLGADVNGDSQVAAYDRTVAARSKGRSLLGSLRLDG